MKMKPILATLPLTALLLTAPAGLYAQSATTNAPAASTNAPGERMSREELREKLKNMPPEERREKMKEIRERMEKVYTELKEKKANGTITPEEEKKLDRLEEMRARRAAREGGKDAPSNTAPPASVNPTQK